MVDIGESVPMELMLAISARLVASVGLSNSVPGSVYRAMGNSYHIKRETCLQTIRNVFVHVHNYKVLVAKTLGNIFALWLPSIAIVNKAFTYV